jgi:GT2 family glycosyltransferase
MLSSEAIFAPTWGVMAVFRAFQGSLKYLQAAPNEGFGRGCSVFYMAIVEKNEQG